MRRARTAMLVLSAVALVVSGCGKSEKPLTHAQLTQKANAICKRVQAQIASVNVQAADANGIARIAPKLSSFEQAALAEMGKLVPPDDLADDWKQFLAGAQTLADDTAKLGEYAKAHNLEAAKGLIKSSTEVQTRMKSIASNDGFTDCEQVP